MKKQTAFRVGLPLLLAVLLAFSMSALAFADEPNGPPEQTAAETNGDENNGRESEAPATQEPPSGEEPGDNEAGEDIEDEEATGGQTEDETTSDDNDTEEEEKEEEEEEQQANRTPGVSARASRRHELPGDTNFDGVVDLLDFSNMVDWFGIDSNHPEWYDFYVYFDFGNNGRIDIYAIAYVARIIEDGHDL